MMGSLQAIGVMGMGVLGVCYCIRALPMFRRAGLPDRLYPYLGSLSPRESRLTAAVKRPGRAFWTAITDDLGTRLQHLLGDDPRELADRLAAAGERTTPTGFRSQQVVWGMTWFLGATCAVVFLAATGRPVAPGAAIVAVFMFGVFGVVRRDRKLETAIKKRRARMLSEFPTVVDLICLSVTAGESLHGALDAVMTSCDGPLASELRGVLRETRSGQALAPSLEACAQRLQLAPFSRFVEAVIAAQERGIPLADSLRAMSADVREAHKNNLMEIGGRKQVAMLLPVVGLILPVAIIFAFYPGVIAIKTLAR